MSSARATLTAGVVGGVLRFSIPAIGIAGVGSSQELDGFISPVRRNAATGLNTGVAVSSTGEVVTLSLTLRDSDGVAVAEGTAEMELVANGHRALFIDQLFPQATPTVFREP